ncbi:MAG: DUF3089 domain-containing protein [Eubacteriales bacterium]|nr:DUF3089 domain-containing protein [Eubacteriales bacterium]
MRKNSMIKRRFLCVILSTIIALPLIISGCGQDNGSEEGQDKNSVPQIVASTTGSESWENTIDYSMADNWLSQPESIEKDVDVIYFYPTCYSKENDDDLQVCDIDNKIMRQGAEAMKQGQLSVFADSCNLYAPFYRQVEASYALSIPQKDNEDLMRYSASKDPAAALDYYFENLNEGRPFILAGHSQGSEILTFVLADYMEEHPDYYKRMVAAYVIGYSVTDRLLDENTHLKFAEGPDDTGVIISYNTEGPENKDQHNAVVLDGAIAINPINWKRDNTYADKSENLGSFLATGEYVEHLADAQLDTDRGVVICSSVDKETYTLPMPELFGHASYHRYDYGFYYENLKKNIADRIDAYMNK